MNPRRVLPLLLAIAAAWGGAQALQAWRSQALAPGVNAGSARAPAGGLTSPA